MNNWPNRLSILRVLLIPVIVILLYASAPWCAWSAAIFFALAAFTDFLDGYLARRNHLITDFGKFIDPVADKLLVLSTMIMLIHLGILPAWMVIIILARELSVDGLRLVAMTKGQVISAGPLGKIKTASQMLMLVLMLILRKPLFSFVPGIIIGIWITGITIWSGADYFVRNADILK